MHELNVLGRAVQAAFCFIVLFPISGCRHNGNLQPYVGQWVLKSSGKNLMVLRTTADRRHLRGTLTRPKHFTEQADGTFSHIKLPIETVPIRKNEFKNGRLLMLIGKRRNSDVFSTRLVDSQHLLARWATGRVPDWIFQKVPDSPRFQVFQGWQEYSADPAVASLQKQFESLASEDQQARNRTHISDSELEDLAAKAQPVLESTFTRYGWPKLSVFGTEACNNFWLLVQHQPLSVEQQMLPAMRSALAQGEASSTNYAYLFDRVQVDEGKPQHWGTQAHCEGIEAKLFPVDDPARLDDRRAALAMEPIAQYLSSLKSLCARGSSY